jgi:hypothetical protein
VLHTIYLISFLGPHLGVQDIQVREDSETNSVKQEVELCSISAHVATANNVENGDQQVPSRSEEAQTDEDVRFTVKLLHCTELFQLFSDTPQKIHKQFPV